ncbi:hypothetical protein C0993_005316 [Termitomyces sp. T159_Od127]|nr:hypothetical protein C0993_005316 [Termitomyces sp. T159_Od127]
MTPTTALGPDRYLANLLGSPWPSPAITATSHHHLQHSSAITAMTATSALASAITPPIAATSVLASATPIAPGLRQDPHHASQSCITADPTSTHYDPLLLPHLRPATTCLCISSTRPPHCTTCLNPHPALHSPQVSPQAPVPQLATGTWA